MKHLFFYGTLCHAPLLERVLGRALDDLALQEASLPDHAVFWVAGDTFPVIEARAGAQAHGLLVRGLTDADIARLDFYEGGYDYALREMPVETARGPQEARIYFPLPDRLRAGAPWDLNLWIAEHADLAMEAALEVMDHFGKVAPEVIEKRYPQILLRASARLAARHSAPVTLRHKVRPGDVQIESRTQPYTDYFAVTDLRLRHRRFNGTMSDVMDRAAFVSGDSATVLPYDPVRDRVLLIEQFRIGPIARGDAQCWLLEPIAGRIDPGETPESTAHREALEEAGLTLGALHKVSSFYPSPGALTEYMTSFVGIADLPDGVAGVGGLETEQEDIRAHLVSFDQCMDLLQTGELDVGPLVLSVLWLASNRDRLRAAA